MAFCDFCAKELVGFPFTCKLCEQPFCGDHRLPESHKCLNVHVYRSPDYYNVTLAKQREMAAIKSRKYIVNSSSEIRMSNNDLMKGAAVHGFVGILSILLIFLTFTPYSGITMLLPIGALLIGGIGYSILCYQVINNIRNRFLAPYGSSSDFKVNTRGIVITILTALVIFPILMFGSFTEERVDREILSRVTFRTVWSFFAAWVIGVFLGSFMISGSFNVLLLSEVSTQGFLLFTAFRLVAGLGVILAANLFLVFAIFSFIPFLNYRADIMLDTNPKLFAITLVLMIASIILLVRNLPFFALFGFF